MKKLLTLVVAGLDHSLVQRYPLTQSKLDFRALETVFPALTCPVQASLRTGLGPEEHGMFHNGVYNHDLGKVLFWEQSARLVKGDRIWKDFRSTGGRVGMMFWQQSMGESVDWIVSPKPIHKHSGGLIQHCYSEPPSLYNELQETVGRPFKLQHYWGPLASFKASLWISDMICAALDRKDCPEWLFSYLPHLDYVLQREGPEGASVAEEMNRLDAMLARILSAASKAGYECVVLGDYAIAPVQKVVYPNRMLREHNYFSAMPVGKMTYPNLGSSRAFAVVDHEVAEVVISNPEDLNVVQTLLDSLDGVEKSSVRTAEDGSIRLMLTAEEGVWFAYPWWTDPKEAPDFATHVDIHNKPGFDPCELFFGWPPLSVSTNPARVQGSHGRVGVGREVACASTDSQLSSAKRVVELAHALQEYMA